MTFSQNSEIRALKSGIPQMCSIVKFMPWMHSLGPPKVSVTIQGLLADI